MLIFLHENQSVFYWAVRRDDIQQPDPPVYQTDDLWRPQWVRIHHSMTEALIAWIYWQALLGGLAYVGSAALNDATPIRATVAHWTRITLAPTLGTAQVYTQPGKALAIEVMADHLELYAGGRTRQDFLEIDTLLQTPWDYSTLDDEEA